MSPCAFHPELSAIAICELCGTACCRECARTLLGRTYCPTCAERVRAITTGGKTAPVAASSAASVEVGASAALRPRLPGWASALCYAVLWFGVLQVSQTLLALPLFISNLTQGGMNDFLNSKFDLMSADRIGLPLWSFFMLLLGWGSLLVTIAVTAGCMVWLERRRFLDLGLRHTPHIGRDLITGLLFASVLFISVIGLGAGRGLYSVNRQADGGDALLIGLMGFLILLPFAAIEEIAMRGYVLQAIRRSWGTGAGVAISTLLFVALHLANPGLDLKHNPLALVGLALAGLYLTLAYQITGDLWFAIFLHTGWNLMEGPIFGTPVSGQVSPASVFVTRPWGESIWTGGSFGPEAGLLLCGLMLVHLAALWALRPVLGRTPPDPDLPPYDPTPPTPAEYRAIPLGSR